MLTDGSRVVIRARRDSFDPRKIGNGLLLRNLTHGTRRTRPGTRFALIATLFSTVSTIRCAIIGAIVRAFIDLRDGGPVCHRASGARGLEFFELVVEVGLFNQAEVFADFTHCASHEFSVGSVRKLQLETTAGMVTLGVPRAGSPGVSHD